MATKIWRYTLTAAEQKLWDNEELAGWRAAMEGCVEDEAREAGSKKYILYNRQNQIIAKGDVKKLPEPEVIEV
jgi:hypothetical protein